MTSLLLILLLSTLTGLGTVKGEVPEFVVEEDEEVVLSCPVNTPECGDYHSLKWYRDSSRVYVYSPIALFSNAEGSLMDRCLDISQRSLGPACPRGSLSVTDSSAELKISPIKLTDDGQYRCEITYLDVSNNCPVVHLTNVRTVAPPVWVTVSVSGDQSQPAPAGSVISVSCISGGGKPRPTFTWRLGEQEITDHTEEGDEQEARSEVSFTLEEEHDGLEIQCLVENEVSVSPLMDQFKLDVEVPVRTVSLDLDTVSGREGQEMTLTCTAQGGPPTPRVSWELPLDTPSEHTHTTSVLEDDTLETVSHLTFTPSSLHDLEVIQCRAINDVMSEAITYEAVLDIQYPPSLIVSPDNQTLLEGEEGTLECLVTSNPGNVTVKWFHHQQELDIDGDKYSVSQSDSGTHLLLISNISSSDTGDFSCSAENDLGTGSSENSAMIDVLYPPSVSVSSDVVLVSEEVGGEVRLTCSLESGHPADLLGVNWFRDGQPLLSSPFLACGPGQEYDNYELGTEEGEEVAEECEEFGQAEVRLVSVDRRDGGLYSCQGYNSAGLGDISPELELIVQYQPGPSQILQTEEFLTKGSSANFICLLEEQGSPETEIFSWKLGDTILEEISENLTLTNIGVESQQNLTCSAVNEIGSGESDSLQITVFAPPSFITALPEALNVLSDDPDFALTCQVECDPICEIVWIRDGTVVDKEDEMFEILEEVHAEDSANSVFMSVRSRLVKRDNVTLDHDETNMTISCQVSDHQFGDSISSSSILSVEYPPEEVTVDQKSLELIEGEEMEPVTCSGSGSPELTFYWTLQEEEEVVGEGDVLSFSQPVERSQAGEYLCHGANRHGERVADFSLSVLYRPECSLSYTFEEDQIVLLCEASANPDVLTFSWDKGNQTYLGDTHQGEGYSQLRIKIQNDSLGDYTCHVSNSVGESDPCSVQTEDILLKKEDSKKELILIIVIVITALVILLFLALVTFYYFYRKGNKANPNSDEKEKQQEKTRSNKSFYENLPFQGLKSPPEKVISPPPTEDNLDYADADYKDLYVEGPKGYRKIPDSKPKLSSSQENANGL